MTERSKMVPTEELVDRGVYEVHSRNLIWGVYDAERRWFVGIREKFGSTFLFAEGLNDPPGSGTALAIRFIEPLPKGIPNTTDRDNHYLFNYLNQLAARTPESEWSMERGYYQD